MKSLNKLPYLFLLFILFFISEEVSSQVPDSVGYIVKIGDMAPDFRITYPDGSSEMLSDLRGQTVMLQFTASWCSVCRKEMPHIEREIWQAYKDKGLKVIGIDRDEPADTLLSFAKKMKISYPLALDPGADIFGLYADKKSGVTRNVLIDKSGRIVYLTRLYDKKEFEGLKSKIREEINK